MTTVAYDASDTGSVLISAEDKAAWLACASGETLGGAAPRLRRLRLHGGACRHRHGGAARLRLADARQRVPLAGDRLHHRRRTAITGGVGSVGSVWKTFIGALIVAVVRIGMTFVGVTIFAQQIVFGVVLVVAVAVTMDRSKIATVK